MTALTKSEHQLLDRLAAEGKATTLTLSELEVARALEPGGLVFIVGNTFEAIVMPKGRHLLAGLACGAKRKTPPFGFTS